MKSPMARAFSTSVQAVTGCQICCYYNQHDFCDIPFDPNIELVDPMDPHCFRSALAKASHQCTFVLRSHAGLCSHLVDLLGQIEHLCHPSGTIAMLIKANAWNAITLLPGYQLLHYRGRLEELIYFITGKSNELDAVNRFCIAVANRQSDLSADLDAISQQLPAVVRSVHGARIDGRVACPTGATNKSCSADTSQWAGGTSE